MKKLFITSGFLCLAIILVGAQVCFAPPGSYEDATYPESCFDGSDNDLDELTDCADPGCENAVSSESCDTGLLGECRWGFYKCISGAKKCIGRSPISEVCGSATDWDCDGLPADSDPDCAVPICDANGPYTAECGGTKTSVALDGTGSSNPTGGALTYSWSTNCPGGSFNNATSATPTLTLNSTSTGVNCNVTLTVTNSSGLSSTCSSTVNVVDTTPPLIICPPDIIGIGCDESPQPPFTGIPLATDVCDPNPIIIYTDVITPATCPDFYTILRTWTAKDDNGNSSTCRQEITVVENTDPQVTIIKPQANQALQDGTTFQASASDYCSGVDQVFFSVRESDGGSGTPIGYEDLAATFNSATWDWDYPFNTTMLQDGYYVILAKAIDSCGNEGMSSIEPFSIRNWAVIVLLPSTPSSKAGRTMPVKFSLRIAASVDPAMPFVYNEDLEIRIYDAKAPGTILQSSLFGTGATDYRINGEIYITNFKTGKKPTTYVVEIWRPTKNFLVGSFTFKTVK